MTGRYAFETNDLAVLKFPLCLLGAELGRTVTLLRLGSGEIVVHSTAAFNERDVQTITRFGKPVALLDATLFHDSYAKQGRAAFPNIPYFGPVGLPAITGVNTIPLSQWPGSWANEIQVLELAGMPRMREYAVLHVPSRTLVLADLVFNFGPAATPWTRFFFRAIAGVRPFPGISRLYRTSIHNRSAFKESIRQMLNWDFDRIIPGHGEIIEHGGKAALTSALREHDLLPL